METRRSEVRYLTLEPENLYLNNEITLEEFAEAINKELDDNEKLDERKFYQIDAKIINGEEESQHSFIIKTINTERGMMVINHYMKSLSQEDSVTIAMAEKISPLSIAAFIPQQFTDAYMTCQENEKKY